MILWGIQSRTGFQMYCVHGVVLNTRPHKTSVVVVEPCLILQHVLLRFRICLNIPPLEYFDRLHTVDPVILIIISKLVRTETMTMCYLIRIALSCAQCQWLEMQEVPWFVIADIAKPKPTVFVSVLCSSGEKDIGNLTSVHTARSISTESLQNGASHSADKVWCHTYNLQLLIFRMS